MLHPKRAAIARLRGRLRLSDLISLNDFLWSVDETDIIVDFSKYTHSSIFDLVFLSHQFRNLQLKKQKKIQAINHEHMVWANGMNFFSVSGADWTSELSVSAGDGFNYIPITVVERKNQGIRLSHSEMNEEIDRQAVKLARVLLHLGSGPSFDTMQYTFREIVRNIFEHSGARSFLIAGQYYPKHRNVQIVLADNGLGIQNSLRFNKPFEKLDDRAALNMALMPGVSGNAKAMSDDTRSKWQNSGYGLYMASRLAINYGLMTVVSGKQIIHIKSNENHKPIKEGFSVSNFDGTLIRIGMQLTDDDLADQLKKWAEEGKKIARDIVGAKQIDASAASLLLRRDFERELSRTKPG